jgi:hypothetical protein
VTIHWAIKPDTQANRIAIKNRPNGAVLQLHVAGVDKCSILLIEAATQQIDGDD